MLDAGCGTGALAIEAARRGAEVVAIDLSPNLVAVAEERMPAQLGTGRITFCSGDMLDAKLGSFDHVVCMDSLIHYQAADAVTAIRQLAARADRATLFTFAPRTALLGTALAIGKMFPRGDRSPRIEPQREAALRRAFNIARSARVSAGFYISQAMEIPAC